MESNSDERNPALDPPLLSSTPAPQIEADHVIASRCRACAYTGYPPLSMCPECFGRDHEALPLAGAGVLYSFSRVHVGARAADGPYVVGYVDTPEQARLFAIIDDTPDLRLDAPVRLTANGAPPRFAIVAEGAPDA
jgi:uncharacterized OB-fold protein